MQTDELYTELTDYIYNYCAELMTEDELMAASKMGHTPKEVSLQQVQFRLSNWKADSNENVKVIIRKGFDILKTSFVERIYLQHKDELELNLCPQCGKIARTPQAKQCRFCFYDWHNH